LGPKSKAVGPGALLLSISWSLAPLTDLEFAGPHRIFLKFVDARDPYLRRIA
jgi:hypothetical protein